ncbi:unnamed protein product [Citrullus colocynthis]|uniref:Uncharacterized protein n=1 Tax=Citrullus colocynthis TaxID=252529 RepID=A0ABP0YPW7_9ROSI
MYWDGVRYYPQKKDHSPFQYIQLDVYWVVVSTQLTVIQCAWHHDALSYDLPSSIRQCSSPLTQACLSPFFIVESRYAKEGDRLSLENFYGRTLSLKSHQLVVASPNPSVALHYSYLLFHS